MNARATLTPTFPPGTRLLLLAEQGDLSCTVLHRRDEACRCGRACYSIVIDDGALVGAIYAICEDSLVLPGRH